MRLPRFATSLVARIILFGVVMVAAGSLARFTLVSHVLKKGIEDIAAIQQMSLANYVASDIDEKIRSRQRLLESMAKELPAALLDQPQQLEAWLAQRHTHSPLFSLGITVIPANGKGVIADFPPLAGRRQLDFTESDWFRAAREKGTFAIGKPMPGRLTNEGIIVMAAPYRDAQGRVVAVITGVTALAAPGFLDLIENNALGETGGFLLVSPRDKIFVAASMPNMRLKPTPPPGANPQHDRAMAGWRGTGVAVNAFGVEELVALASVPSVDWFVVARLPTAEAYRPVAGIPGIMVRLSVAAGGIMVVILLAFLTYVFRPMKDAAHQMRRMADGLAPLAKLPVVRHDEIGEMVEGFNALVDKLHESEARMVYLAHHDALTSLPNRMSFLTRMQQSVALALRHKSKLALMFIDLDDFKPINDRYGHEAGDQLLRKVAARLGEGVRQADTVARFGGDEFVLLLTDVPDRESAAAIAEKLIAKLSAPYLVGQVELAIGASIGIAIFPDDADDLEPLIAQADAAMYDAKHAGRKCVRFARKRVATDTART